MIIWARWGFLSFIGFGIGVAIALGLAPVLNLPDSGPVVGATVFACAALVNLVLALWVYPRLDKPRVATVTRPLPEPVTDEHGRVRTHEVFPVLDPEGREVVVTPRSTLFFIPVAYLWMVLAAVAVILGVVALFS